MLFAGVVTAPAFVEPPVPGTAQRVRGATGRVLYEAPPEWCARARETARKRREAHAAAGNRRHWGDPTDCSEEYFGSLASIALHRQSLDIGVPMELTALYVPNARVADLPPWDARVGDITIEIKAIPPDTQRPGERPVARRLLLVKKEENHFSQFYVAVKFESQTTYWFPGFASLAEVLAAPEFKKFKPAYALPLTSLRRLSEAPWMPAR